MALGRTNAWSKVEEIPEEKSPLEDMTAEERFWYFFATLPQSQVNQIINLSYAAASVIGLSINIDIYDEYADVKILNELGAKTGLNAFAQNVLNKLSQPFLVQDFEVALPFEFINLSRDTLMRISLTDYESEEIISLIDLIFEILKTYSEVK